MSLTKEMITKAKTAASAEELLKLAAEEGITLTENEAKECFDQLNKKVQIQELSDEELENIAGGKGGPTYSSDPPYRLITTAFNSCPGCKVNGVEGVNSYCIFCERRYSTGINPTIYCEARKKGRDPYAKK